jgi:hypothetical protein
MGQGRVGAAVPTKVQTFFQRYNELMTREFTHQGSSVRAVMPYVVRDPATYPVLRASGWGLTDDGRLTVSVVLPDGVGALIPGQSVKVSLPRRPQLRRIAGVYSISAATPATGGQTLEFSRGICTSLENLTGVVGGVQRQGKRFVLVQFLENAGGGRRKAGRPSDLSRGRQPSRSC